MYLSNIPEIHIWELVWIYIHEFVSVYNDPWNVLIQRTRKTCFVSRSFEVGSWGCKETTWMHRAGRSRGRSPSASVASSASSKPKRRSRNWADFGEGWWYSPTAILPFDVYQCRVYIHIYILHYIYILYTSNQWMSFIDGNLKATNLGFLFFGEYLEILQCTAAADPNCARKSGWLRLCHKTARAWEGAHEKRLSMEQIYCKKEPLPVLKGNSLGFRQSNRGIVITYPVISNIPRACGVHFPIPLNGFSPWWSLHSRPSLLLDRYLLRPSHNGAWRLHLAERSGRSSWQIQPTNLTPEGSGRFKRAFCVHLRHCSAQLAKWRPFFWYLLMWKCPWWMSLQDPSRHWRSVKSHISVRQMCMAWRAQHSTMVVVSGLAMDGPGMDHIYLAGEEKGIAWILTPHNCPAHIHVQSMYSMYSMYTVCTYLGIIYGMILVISRRSCTLPFLLRLWGHCHRRAQWQGAVGSPGAAWWLGRCFLHVLPVWCIQSADFIVMTGYDW